MYQVMIVDDEKMIVNSLALGFDWKRCGFEVVATCTSSHEALRMIEFIRPDIVFTDIRMPGLSGLDLLRKIRQKLPQIQFVVISAKSCRKFSLSSSAGMPTLLTPRKRSASVPWATASSPWKTRTSRACWKPPSESWTPDTW